MESESILTSTKKMLGIMEDYDHFDLDIIMHINSVLSILNQLGIGPTEGFAIEDDSATWQEFMQSDKRLEFVKTYVYMKVKLIFDPPLSSPVMEAMNRMVSELEWRILAVEEKEV